MTNKIRTVIPLLAVVVLLSGCAEYKRYAYTSRTTPIADATIRPQAAGVEVEMDFARHVTATSDIHSTRAEAIDNAKYLCLQNNHIDVLVDPIFNVEQVSSGYRATVQAYAGMYKTVSTGVAAFQENEISMEAIEKYKLLNDPSFAQHYYKQFEPEQHITTYNILTDGGERTPKEDLNNAPSKEKSKSLVIQQPTTQPTTTSATSSRINPKYDYKKAKNLYDTGWSFMGAGAALLVGGGALLGTTGGETMEALSISYLAIGAASMVYVGIPMVCVGAYRMKRAPNSPKNNLAVGVTNNGIGMALTF